MTTKATLAKVYPSTIKIALDEDNHPLRFYYDNLQYAVQSCINLGVSKKIEFAYGFIPHAVEVTKFVVTALTTGGLGKDKDKKQLRSFTLTRVNKKWSVVAESEFYTT